jgi:hypothetical protein
MDFRKLAPNTTYSYFLYFDTNKSHFYTLDFEISMKTSALNWENQRCPSSTSTSSDSVWRCLNPLNKQKIA